jgi:hypothetical protein
MGNSRSNFEFVLLYHPPRRRAQRIRKTTIFSAGKKTLVENLFEA